VIEGIPVDRARLRLTATYQVLPELSLGVEWNPQGRGDVGPLANWRVWEETARRPALILGTSSDRIGSEFGRAGYATLSKDLEAWTGLPLAPYAGVAWGSFDDRWREVLGLRVRYGQRWSSTHLWDGFNLHHLLDYAFDSGASLGLVVAEQDGEYFLGLSGSLRLGWPGGSDPAGEGRP
jgi:hypothetical protein